MFILVSGEGEGREEEAKGQGQGTGVEIKPIRCVSDLSQYKVWSGLPQGQ